MALKIEKQTFKIIKYQNLTSRKNIIIIGLNMSIIYKKFYFCPIYLILTLFSCKIIYKFLMIV